MAHSISMGFIEADIEKEQSLLFNLADKYKPEQWAYYLVKVENEEDLGNDNYCEKCIDKAIAKEELRYRKQRGKLHLVIRDLERYGYIVRWRYSNDHRCNILAMEYGDKKTVRRLKREIKLNFPTTTFSYRCYRLESTTSHERCEACGVILQSCVTADEQEIEHWESLEDSCFAIAKMDECTGYELYGILDFIHQADTELYKRGHAIALKVLDVNK